jgi:hAT family C-terminal dimerisation region
VFLIQGTFSDRYNRQVLPIHFAAFYLTPENYQVPLDGCENKLYDFFLQYSKSPQDARALRMEFVSFRNRETPFQPSKWCWDHIEDPRNFWKMVSTEDSKFLRRLAMRIFATPANSVPSERAFSAQNFIHTKLRNSLHPSRVDKIVFIYMNSRVLKNQQKSPYKMSEKEKVEMEDAALLLDEIPTQEELEYQGIDDDADDGDEDDFEDDLKMIE